MAMRMKAVTATASCIRLIFFAVVTVVVLLHPANARADGRGCTYRAEAVTYAPALWHRLSVESEHVAPSSRRRTITRPPAPLRRNFIDDEIFGKMQEHGVSWTATASDAEFLRRVTIDLTGQIPKAETVKRFLADRSPDKRDVLIDELLLSEEFTERWTLWFGDLVQVVTRTPELGDIYPSSSVCFNDYLRASFRANEPYDEMVRAVITAEGHPWMAGPPAAYWVRQIVSYAPVQDTYDNLSADTAEKFLGLQIDCLSCHDGRGHLEAVNSSLAVRTRRDFWKNAAFFARDYAYLDGPGGADDPRGWQCVVDEYSWGVAEMTGTECHLPHPGDDIGDRCEGEYRLNTTTGARTARRELPGGAGWVAPAFFLSGEAPRPGESRRKAYARILTSHPQFARAAANYLWKELFGLGIVEPANSHDLLRHGPDTLPPGSTLQPTHPDLLNMLGAHFASTGYDFRNLIRTIVVSNAYQLSAKYTPGEWNEQWTPYYARRYPRRLLAESIVDAIARATNVPLRLEGSRKIERAMQFNEPNDPGPSGDLIPEKSRWPLRDGLIRFMNTFGRGDRISIPRPSGGSILQALRLLNDPFVTTRVRADNDSTVARLLSMSTDPGTIADELYIATLSRLPAPDERAIAIDLLSNGDLTRNAEDLQFALINKVEFLYR
jgi:hypothetical protein